MHYYQHHIGDFIRDTANLTNEQLAVYLKMIWLYYDKEKPLADDCDGIAFAVRSDEKTVHLLLRHFFKLQDDGWHHTRCDKEIAAFHEKSAKAQNSANARWKNANALQTHTKRNAKAPVFDANQEPITNNQINTPKPPRGEMFDRFWNAYPKKVGKDAALKAFEKRKPDEQLISEMLAAITVQRQTDAWQKENGQFIPNPATWLNQGRWMDETQSEPEAVNLFAGGI